MKRFCFVVALMLVWFALLWAQTGMSFEYEMKLEAPPTIQNEFLQSLRSQTIKSWFQGDWVKIDVANGQSAIIIRKDKGVVWIIDNIGKKYVEFPIVTFEQMMKDAEKQAESITPLVEYRKTGRTKKVERWDCYEVEVRFKDTQTTPYTEEKMFMWVTKAKELDPKKLEETFKWDTFGQFRFNKKALEQTELDGFPVQVLTETTTPQGVIKTVMTLKNFEMKQFSASIFDLPLGYMKVEMPIVPPVQKEN